MVSFERGSWTTRLGRQPAPRSVKSAHRLPKLLIHPVLRVRCLLCSRRGSHLGLQLKPCLFPVKLRNFYNSRCHQ